MAIHLFSLVETITAESTFVYLGAAWYRKIDSTKERRLQTSRHNEGFYIVEVLRLNGPLIDLTRRYAKVLDSR